MWFDRPGKPLETVGDPGRVGNVSLSPDARRLARLHDGPWNKSGGYLADPDAPKHVLAVYLAA
jgi:hypothetical protein